MIHALVSCLVKPLLDNPDALTVTDTVLPDGRNVLQVKVHPRDLNRIIGTEGRIYKSLKTLVGIIDKQHRDLVIDTTE